MNDIIITNDFNEAVKTGKELFKQKASIYTDKMIESINQVIAKNMPDASQAERSDMFYHSIYDYWVYGVNVGEEFYYGFRKLSHEEKKEYVSMRERLIYVDHINNKDDAYILNNKFEAYKRLKKYFKREMILIEKGEDYDSFCDFVSRHKTFVVKPTDMGLGVGVHKLSVSDTDDKQDVFNSLLYQGKGYKGLTNSSSVILEEIIKQSDSLACFHPGSVNSVRITTLYMNNKVNILYPWIKIGVGGAFVTSAFMGSIDAAINGKTGLIETDGIGEFGQREKLHPDTNIKIKGFQIPRWSEALDLARELAMALPSLRYIGWDLALTDDGWCVMEGNYAGDFMWQLWYGKGSKKEFEDMIGWHMDKKFWWQ